MSPPTPALRWTIASIGKFYTASGMHVTSAVFPSIQETQTRTAYFYTGKVEKRVSIENVSPALTSQSTLTHCE
eukprot:1143521-Pelagomonas_calceolata.AAC.3